MIRENTHLPWHELLHQVPRGGGTRTINDVLVELLPHVGIAMRPIDSNHSVFLTGRELPETASVC
jgi:hypothetical protein